MFYSQLQQAPTPEPCPSFGWSRLTLLGSPEEEECLGSHSPGVWMIFSTSSSKAHSTSSLVLALASMKSVLCARAQLMPSFRLTSRPSLSILLPTSIFTMPGLSAWLFSSSSQVFSFSKVGRAVTSYTKMAPWAPR